MRPALPILTTLTTTLTKAPHATLVGRLLTPQGPSIVTTHNNHFVDITCPQFPTISSLFNHHDPLSVVQDLATRSPVLGHVEPLLASLLSPADLQPVKACGVTFAKSMLERVIEEHTGGDRTQAQAFRQTLTASLGELDLSTIVPGSTESKALKAHLSTMGLWSQYLEVGLGPDAEVFTKCQPLSSVGSGADVGIHSCSTWNNPEPELVLAVNRHGRIVGATLGNDVNLRDVEGRSALLLGKAKDNNASCSMGPMVRLLDKGFALEDLHTLDIALQIDGTASDGFQLSDTSALSLISRALEELVEQTMSEHQYPDGFMLFTGTAFSPTQDRGEVGNGFSHERGDVVAISNGQIGTLVNTVRTASECPPWTFGMHALMRNLAKRKLL